METRMLRVVLSDLELMQQGRTLVQVLRDIDELEDERKEAAKNYSERVGALLKQSKRLRDVIDSGGVDRETPVEWRPDVEAFTMKLYRLDTEALVEVRPMTDVERQGELFARQPGKVVDLRPPGVPS